MISIKECVKLMHNFGDVSVSKIFNEQVRLSVYVTEECRLEAVADKHRVLKSITWVDDREDLPDENLYIAFFEDNLCTIADVKERLIKAMAVSLKNYRKNS